MRRISIAFLVLTLANVGVAQRLIQNDTASTGSSSSNSTQPVVQAGVSLGTPTYGGTGCESGKLSAALSPDATSMSILFDDFVVDADLNTPIAQKSCNVGIPINVPDGYQVTIVRADYRGFNNLPVGASARFTVEYFLAGETTTPYTEVFHGELTDNYLLQDTVNTATVNWSKCGKPVTFRIKNDIVVYSNANGDQASSTLDSADVKINDPDGARGLQFYFMWQPCPSSSGASSLGASWLLALVPALAILAAGH